MKQQSNFPFIEISKQEIEQLVKVEHEKLAVGFHKKIFRTVDLWNIQRQRKVREPKRTPGPAGV
jgi:hypothetical protein